MKRVKRAEGLAPPSQELPREVAWDLLLPRPALSHLRAVDVPVPKTVRDVAALFVNIEGCARLCDDLPPREMTAVIEVYFGRYLDAVRAAGGDVTEVLGDGVHARAERRRHEQLVVNMGLNAGPALIGFTRLRGRLTERWVYGASGPGTNVAARLCALARGGQILTTQSTAALLPTQHRYRVVGRRRLKNVTRPVEVVEILPGPRDSRPSLEGS